MARGMETVMGGALGGDRLGGSLVEPLLDLLGAGRELSVQQTMCYDERVGS
jgi:hypothetical protein